MENNRYIKVYALSDLFDNTTKMIKSTWKNSLIINLICFTPMSLLSLFVMGKYFQVIIEIMQMGINHQGDMASNPYAILQMFVPMFGYLFVLVFISTLASIFAKSVIALNTFKVIQGENPALKELVLIILNKKLARLLIQPLLLAAIFIGAYLACIIAVAITGGIFMMVNQILGGIVIGIGIVAFICAIIWILNSLNFIQEDVLYADSTVIQSFKNSFHLVRGNWWRVFGILLLINMIVSFAISVITGPLIGSLMMPLTSDLIKELTSGELNITEIYTSILSIYSKAQIPLFFSGLITSVLTFLILPVFTTLFYIDLKVRKKEIAVPDSISPDQPFQEKPDSGNETDPEVMTHSENVTHPEDTESSGKAGSDGE